VSDMSSSSSDSASTSSIPKLPSDRAQFDNWRMVMRAYLDDKGVWRHSCVDIGKFERTRELEFEFEQKCGLKR
jgi:hypothetical protein